MRLSTVKDDAGYLEWCKLLADGHRPAIYVDGVLQNSVTVADEEAGYVERVMKTERGNVVVDRARGEVMTETVRGVVHVSVGEPVIGKVVGAVKIEPGPPDDTRASGPRR